jgi:integrase
MTNATKNRNVMTPAAAILHHAAENKLADYIRIHKFEEILPDPRAVDAAVAELLVRNAKGAMKLLLIWLFLVGTRITETLGVQLEHINREARTLKMKMVKPERWETVPLPDEVLRILPTELGVGPLFPWRNRDQVYRVLRPLC